jgi:hypothetical protein
MKEMFDPCVNRTLELIDGQVASILKDGRSKPKVCNKDLPLSRRLRLTAHADGPCGRRIWEKRVSLSQNLRVLPGAGNWHSQASVSVRGSVNPLCMTN